LIFELFRDFLLLEVVYTLPSPSCSVPDRKRLGINVVLLKHVWDNRACRFYDTEKREGEKKKDSINIQRIIEENYDASPPFATLSHLPG
jgi:hypothetical protein